MAAAHDGPRQGIAKSAKRLCFGDFSAEWWRRSSALQQTRLVRPARERRNTYWALKDHPGHFAVDAAASITVDYR
jgi:hypothetical protein